MSIVVLLVLFGVGTVVGLLSGLVGIGGGVLIVPFLYFFYAHPGWAGVELAADLHAAVAHATSLFIIVPTALRGTATYDRSDRVAWRIALPIAAAAVLAAIAGARLALILPAELLKLAFGVLLVVSGVQMVGAKRASRRHELRTGALFLVLTGAAVGLLSALLGVGGGVVAIPLLVYLIGLNMERVAATSLGVIIFAATAGTITYVVSGWSVAELPPGSLGYVHVLAAVPILLGAMLAVRWGALVNQRLNTRKLRLLFGVALFAMGVRLIWDNTGQLL